MEFSKHGGWKEIPQQCQKLFYRGTSDFRPIMQKIWSLGDPDESGKSHALCPVESRSGREAYLEDSHPHGYPGNHWCEFFLESVCQRNGEAGLYVEAEPEVSLLKDTGNGAVYPPAFLGKRIWRGRNPGEDPASQDPAGVWNNTDADSKEETYWLTEIVLFLFISDGGISKEAQADSLCSTFRYPEAGPKDLPNGIFTKGRDHDQGRTDSIPEALRRTGTFFDERAQGIIPESTGRYAHSGNQWGIKRTSKEDPLKSAD